MKKKSFLREENGASAVEYAMLIGLISLYSFAAYRALSKVTYLVIKNMWSQLTKAGG
ncbi:MAG: Flp family type IVb pilin [candidate division WOR-3 bacterium]